MSARRRLDIARRARSRLGPSNVVGQDGLRWLRGKTAAWFGILPKTAGPEAVFCAESLAENG
jgi:hypothetical protein